MARAQSKVKHGRASGPRKPPAARRRARPASRRGDADDQETRSRVRRAGLGFRDDD